MQQVHVERLRSLYSMMAGLPTQLIYMPLWRSRKGTNERFSVGISDQELIKNSVQHLMDDPGHTCGTTACALGWAAAYPEFKAAGLTSDADGWPVFQGETSSLAGAKFFGIHDHEAMSLFGSAHGTNQKQTFLERLRKLLMRKGIITEKRNQELIELEKVQAEKDKIATYVFGDKNG